MSLIEAIANVAVGFGVAGDNTGAGVPYVRPHMRAPLSVILAFPSAARSFDVQEAKLSFSQAHMRAP